MACKRLAGLNSITVDEEGGKVACQALLPRM